MPILNCTDAGRHCLMVFARYRRAVDICSAACISCTAQMYILYNSYHTHRLSSCSLVSDANTQCASAYAWHPIKGFGRACYAVLLAEDPPFQTSLSFNSEIQSTFINSNWKDPRTLFELLQFLIYMGNITIFLLWNVHLFNNTTWTKYNGSKNG